MLEAGRYSLTLTTFIFSAILNKSDSRQQRKSFTPSIDCDSDDSDDEIFNDIYADLNDLDEFEDFDGAKDVEGIEVYISSDEEDVPANLLYVKSHLFLQQHKF